MVTHRDVLPMATVHERLAAVARERAEADRRTWADVALETRRIYDQVGVRGGARS